MTKPLVIFERDLTGDSVVTREYLLEILKIIIDESLRKSTTKQTPSGQKPAWARILISAISAANSVLKDIDLQESQDRVKALENMI